MSLMTLLTSITFGRLGCLRPYANNCSVSVAARRPAFAISRRSSRRGSFVSERSLQELGVTEYRGQLIVEVVSDPTGELADGFELLDLVQSVLQELTLGDVGRDSGHTGHNALRTPNRREPCVKDPIGEAQLDLKRHSLARLTQVLVECRVVDDLIEGLSEKILGQTHVVQGLSLA